MQIWIVEEAGDDYHGSSVVAWFDDKQDAEDWAKTQDKQQQPCEDCEHRFSYIVYSVPYRGRNETEGTL